jgi:predicted PurR-regulated permease PerM
MLGRGAERMTKLDQMAQIAIIVTGLVVLFAALYAAQSIFAPLALAFVTGIVLSPISDFWDRRGYQPAVGALSSLGLTLVVIAMIAMLIQPLVGEMMTAAPKVWADMQGSILLLKGFIRGVSKVTGDMTAAIAADGPGANGPAASSVTMPGVTEALMVAPALLGQIMVFAGALFFFLLSRNDIYEWAAKLVTGRGKRLKTGRRLRDAERVVSRYFLTIALINGGLGAATALGLEIVGLPGAIVWGVAAAILNFVVYLGPVTVAVGLLFAGIAAFDGFAAVVPMLIFAALMSLEGQFITPALIGRSLSVNPLLIFVAIVLGIWLWGPIGGFVAIPILVWTLVFADMIEQPEIESALAAKTV